MINGALTIGTLDGANVEMREAVGDDNIFIFGLNSKEVDELWEKGYKSLDFYANSIRIKKAVDRLNKGFNGVSFSNIANYLIGGYGISDPYMCLADFDSYYIKSEEIIKAYNDKEKWGKMSLVNVAKAGFFAADRSIKEYADNIWHLKPVK
jgi:starch phosphorylase